jgi:hypothetical protein
LARSRPTLVTLFVLVISGCAGENARPAPTTRPAQPHRETTQPQRETETRGWWLRQAGAEVPLPSPAHALADHEVLYRAARIGDEETVNAVTARQAAGGLPLVGLVRAAYDIADRERAKIWLNAGDDARAEAALERVSPKARDLILGELASQQSSNPERAVGLASQISREDWRYRSLRVLMSSDNRLDGERWAVAVAAHLPVEQRNLELASGLAPPLVRARKPDPARASLARAETLLDPTIPVDLFDVPTPRKGRAPQPRDESRERGFRLKARAAMAEAYLRLGDRDAYHRHVDAIKAVIEEAGLAGHGLTVQRLIRGQVEAGDVDGALETAAFGEAQLEPGRTGYFNKELVSALAAAGQFERAERLAKASGLADSPEYRQGLVVVRARRGDVRGALDAAVQSGPGRSPSEWASVIAGVAIDAGHVEAAEDAIAKVDPGWQRFQLYERAATARAKAGDNTGARASLRRAMDALAGVPADQRPYRVRTLFEEFVTLGDLDGAGRVASIEPQQAEFHGRLAVLHARGGDAEAYRAALSRAENLVADTAVGEAAARIRALSATAAARAVGGDRAGFEAFASDARKLAAADTQLRLGGDNPWRPIAAAYRDVALLDELAKQVEKLDRPDRVALGIAVYDALTKAPEL